MNHVTKLAEIIKNHEADLLNDWIKNQLTANTLRKDIMKENELRQQSQHLLSLLQTAIQHGNITNIKAPEWDPTLGFLADISRTRSQQGFSTLETATFVFSLKQSLFRKVQTELAQNNQALTDTLWIITTLLDQLGLYTIEVHQKTRESIIKRQQEEMLELSTPVVKLWEGILALPMIGTLDSHRTQIVMESLLQKIVETSCEIAIIDITGVPNVDTLVAQHLLKTITAARLMGADCIISGIRPQIAQTIVHLGVNLEGVITKATLADAFLLALNKVDRKVAQINAKVAA